MLILSSKGEIIFEEENCLDVSKSYPGAPVEILKCHGMGGNQKWEHDKKSVSRRLNFSSLRSLSRSQRFHYIMYTSDWSFVLSGTFRMYVTGFPSAPSWKHLHSAHVWMVEAADSVNFNPVPTKPCARNGLEWPKTICSRSGSEALEVKGSHGFFFFFFSIFFWNFILFYLEGLGMGVHTPYNVDNWITAVQGCYHFFLSPGNY